MNRPKSLNWFLRRIWTWKRITRDSFGCKCNSCIDTETNWMEVCDKWHADILYTTQCDFLIDWIPLNYRDCIKQKKQKIKKLEYKVCKYCNWLFKYSTNMQYCCKEHSRLWNQINKKLAAEKYYKEYYRKNKEKIMEKRLLKSCLQSFT